MASLIGELYRAWPDLAPFVYVDVGANGGVPNLFGVPDSHFRAIGFEPDRRAYEQLVRDASAHVKVFNAALADRDGPRTFYLTRKSECSSIYPPNVSHLSRFPMPERFDVMQEETLHVRTLDAVLSEGGVDFVDFMKLDTQGSELDVLKGSSRTLRGTYGLMVEVEFVQHYQGQPLFSDLDPFVRGHGYELFDIRRVYWKRKRGGATGGVKGQLVHGDALYLRNSQHFLAELAKHDDPVVARAKLIKGCAIAAHFGYNDCALELLDQSRGRSCDVDGRAREILMASLSRCDYGKGPRGMTERMARKFQHLHERLTLRYARLSKGFGFGDLRIGNRLHG